jgi:hypothetical protein
MDWQGRGALSVTQRHLLADTLRGTRPKQRYWANAALRDYAVAWIAAQFGGDWN